MDLIESTQEFLLNHPQKIYLHTWADGGIPRAKTVDEIFAELEGMLWWGSNEDVSYNCAEVTVFNDDPNRRWRLIDMMTVDLERQSSVVTFIDLTHCDDEDFATDTDYEYEDDY